MTDEEIDEGLAVCEAATEGPWRRHHLSMQCINGPAGRSVCDVYEAFGKDNAEFIAAARTGWPRALKALQETRRERDEAIGMWERLVASFRVACDERDEARAKLVEAERERDAAVGSFRTEMQRQIDTTVADMAKDRNEAHAQAAAMREALVECVPRMANDEVYERGRVALAPDAGRALLAELAAHRARASGLCSAHQTANDPTCRVCYPDTGAELAALREVAEVVRRLIVKTRGETWTAVNRGSEIDACGDALTRLDALQKP